MKFSDSIGGFSICELRRGGSYVLEDRCADGTIDAWAVEDGKHRFLGAAETTDEAKSLCRDDLRARREAARSEVMLARNETACQEA